MASFSHGVYTQETATSLLATTEVLSAVPFVVGIAPVNLATNPAVNTPVLCYSQAEAVEAFGLEQAITGTDGLKRFRYSLSEVIYSTFNLYGQTPVVLVNVSDPAKHVKTANTTSVTLDSKGTATISERGLVLSTLSISRTDGTADTWVQDQDFTAVFDDDGYLVISSLSNDDGLIMPTGEALTITAQVLDPSAVTASDIIGGIDAATGGKKGLELISEVFPRFGVIPTMVVCPGFSSQADVAAIMATKALKINTLFDAMALVDLPATANSKYSDVPSVKTGSNLIDANMIVGWPLVNMSGTIYHMSTALAGVLARNDANNDGVPYNSPSNKSVEATGLCLEDGSEVVLGNEEANYLNGEGITTCLNFGSSGWRIWGNRTAAYPASTDVKDMMIPVRRMFQYVSNTIITSIWQRVDDPGNRRLIDSIVDSLNVWLNSLVSRQYLLDGARVEFRQDENSDADLMNGKYTFKVYLTPPSPAEQLLFNLEIDVSAYQSLFS